jgi:glutamyl-tRNA synthetase
MYITRIAPSPTGDMHIGTARTAYFNWLAARASGGQFILRIDDTDEARNKPEYTQTILDTMSWLGLDYDRLEFQSHRQDRYTDLASQLTRSGFAELDDCAIRFRPNRYVPPTHWHDEIAGDIPISTKDLEEMDGMVLIKRTGGATYNFASVVDDADFNVNFIIRGVDHISNTAKQVVLWDVLGRPVPKMAHVGLICVKNKPMSKRDGAASMLHYKNSGYDPDAMLNFLGRMGWGPKIDDKSTAILPREKMIELFLNGGTMRNAPSGFDLAKLESYDRKYKAKKGIWRNRNRLMQG